eukprot:Sspe_Gene.43616::Locus_21291_Transcript_1_1_Confidence_1.000_Length_1809::g.43616::m.43616
MAESTVSSDRSPEAQGTSSALPNPPSVGIRPQEQNPCKRQTPCKFHQHGQCFRGPSCSFSHTDGKPGRIYVPGHLRTKYNEALNTLAPSTASQSDSSGTSVTPVSIDPSSTSSVSPSKDLLPASDEDEADKAPPSCGDQLIKASSNPDAPVRELPSRAQGSLPPTQLSLPPSQLSSPSLRGGLPPVPSCPSPSLPPSQHQLRLPPSQQVPPSPPPSQGSKPGQRASFPSAVATGTPPSTAPGNLDGQRPVPEVHPGHVPVARPLNSPIAPIPVAAPSLQHPVHLQPAWAAPHHAWVQVPEPRVLPQYNGIQHAHQKAVIVPVAAPMVADPVASRARSPAVYHDSGLQVVTAPRVASPTVATPLNIATAIQARAPQNGTPVAAPVPAAHEARSISAPSTSQEDDTQRAAPVTSQPVPRPLHAHHSTPHFAYHPIDLSAFRHNQQHFVANHPATQVSAS